MRILLVSPYFPPQPAVASLRVHSFAAAWGGAGEDVTVLTTRKRSDQRSWPRPAGPFHVVEVPYRASILLETARRVVKRDEAAAAGASGPSAPGRTRSGPLRRLRERRGVFSSVRMPDLTDAWVRPAAAWARGQPAWDVVVSSAGPYTAHLAALAIAGARPGPRWVAEFRDLWTGNHVYRGLFPFTLRERALERRCLRRSDLVVTVSEALARILDEQSTAPAMVVYNGFDPSETADLPAARAFPADDAKRLVFTGSLYPGQDPTPLLRGLAAMRQTAGAAPAVRLVVAGPATAQWTAAAQRHGVADLLETRGTVGRAEARHLQRDADALVLVDFEAAVEGALTTKLFEYLGVGGPVLVVGGADASAAKTLLRDAGRGIVLGHAAAAVARVLADLAADRLAPPPARRPGLVGTFTREHQAQRLLERIRGLP